VSLAKLVVIWATVIMCALGNVLIFLMILAHVTMDQVHLVKMAFHHPVGHNTDDGWIVVVLVGVVRHMGILVFICSRRCTTVAGITVAGNCSTRTRATGPASVLHAYVGR